MSNSKLLNIMKTAWHVHFEECRDGALWYVVTYGSPPEIAPVTDADWGEQYLFRIPLEDVSGAVFPSVDDNPKYYMRWIRRQLEADEAQEQLIEQARADWQKEQEQ